MRKWLCLSCLFVTASLWLPVVVDGEMRWGSGLSDLEAACDCLYYVGKNAMPRHGRMFVMAESVPNGREKRTPGTECHAPARQNVCDGGKCSKRGNAPLAQNAMPRHGRMCVMAESVPSGGTHPWHRMPRPPAWQNVCDGGKCSKRGNAPLAHEAGHFGGIGKKM